MMSVIADVNHQRIKTNGIWMHIAEKGTGPLVLLLHGFPEIWYSWRHQINFLAKHGYRVVAPDLRGYGDTDSPLSPSSYTAFHIVGDLIGLLDHFGQEQAFVVGIDWGAAAAWQLSLLRPNRVRGIVALSVPFTPRFSTIKTTDSFKQMFGDNFYVCQFQEPGRAEKSFARYDYLTVMKKFYLISKTDQLIAPPGAFNYYRAMDLNWELLAPWQGSKITVPAKLIVGNKDIGFDSGTREYIEGNVFKSLVPNHEVVILDGHHFIQQERAQEVSEQILSFLRKFPAK
ncbi:epoxide hydrolase 1 isoform X2 [Coffea arabica]|uniref:Epoxide hydrolase 1 isoform X2 n=1 Tax=Coffea arabica TaxID=13443 RepID=A0ABM4V201_COFAR